MIFWSAEEKKIEDSLDDDFFPLSPSLSRFYREIFGERYGTFVKKKRRKKKKERKKKAALANSEFPLNYSGRSLQAINYTQIWSHIYICSRTRDSFRCLLSRISAHSTSWCLDHLSSRHHNSSMCDTSPKRKCCKAPAL